MDAVTAKKRRSAALSTFTRNEKALNALLDDDSPKQVVTPQYEKLQACWNKLEEIHDAFIEVADGDIPEVDLNKLDEPNERYLAVVKRYSTFLKTSDTVERTQLEQKEKATRDAEEALRKEVEAERRATEEEEQKAEMNVKFLSSKAELNTGIDAFSRLVASMTLNVGGVSDSVKREELSKVETEFNELKSQLVRLSGQNITVDKADINKNFVDNAETVYLNFVKLVTPELKDSHSSTSGGSSDKYTKREPVDLPSFQGDDKASPFGKFPIWKKQWDVQILDYEPRDHWRMLEKKLDEAARSKFIGYEGNYDEAMKRLAKYYGNRNKVVWHVLEEVLTPDPISDSDYPRLISYTVTLENNYSRLSSMNAQHEMSNTSTMSAIVSKFPKSVCEKWHEHILQKSDNEQAQPFPIFIEWLVVKKEIWECMVSTDIDNKHSKSSFLVHELTGGGGDSSERKCYGCHEEGHIRRNCPKQKNNNNDRNQPRKAPSVKKFWCALHKDEKSRKCSSQSCNELRKMTDIQARIRLLKENGDCNHCCGDHKPNDCQFKDRICGGGKVNRGCSKGHKIHELFCAEAKVCMFVSMSVADDNKLTVMLCIMQVPAPRGLTASVFWDSGSQSNFITEQFAKRCGFSGKEETLSVTTLGGVVSDSLTVIEYNCELKDISGKMVKFKAYGMECITGNVSQIGFKRLRTLFPRVSEQAIRKLQRNRIVDILIGLPHPSMHPQPKVRAKGGGDLWIFEGQFGSCVGGRHPQLKEETFRSNDLFTVNTHIHYTKVSSLNIMSHELEYCPVRSEIPYYLSVKSKSVQCVDSLEHSSEEPKVVEISSSEELVVDLPVSVELSDYTCETTDKVSCECFNDLNVENVSAITVPSASSLATSSNIVSTDSIDNSNVCITDVDLDIENTTLNVDAPLFVPGMEWNTSTNNDKNPAEIHCNATMTGVMGEDAFFKAESLGTVINPQCGGCRCNHCPVPGSKYSFKEQQEFDSIMENLV